jgi:hypothetical protein
MAVASTSAFWYGNYKGKDTGKKGREDMALERQREKRIRMEISYFLTLSEQ